MRIQHNIMAMNAYRNYNNNTSALSKNLEKLSSGYKINRAGDDAAGLAISEKMRAQITGLQAASKNVKDGVSLVKTAEGAMQEIHDMLNRMDYLATQSANGTYDNDVDRANLQKEVDSLRSEIDRIADSANFNGIKLLDGSLEAGADLTLKGNIDIPNVGTVQGTSTVVHKEAGTPVTKTSFEVNLHNVTFDAKRDGDTLKLTVGGHTLTATAAAGVAKAYTGKDLADLFAADATGKATIDGQEFTVTATTTGLKFEQTADATATTLVNGNVAVKLGAVTGTGAAVTGDYNLAATNIQNATLDSGERLASTSFELTKDMVTDGSSITIGKTTYTFKALNGAAAGANDVDITGLDGTKAADLVQIAAKLTAKANANTTYSVGHDGATSTITVTEKKGQTDFQANNKSSLTSKEAIQATLSVTGAPATGKALTLQIGDTSDGFNQLSVKVGDMHTKAMGTKGTATAPGKSIADISIANQEDAAAAVAVIKDAINYVSSVRGDLGATQNRLEHTQNNLSVMTENIQDAESTIRDTDVADEMMAYTKNNILIQSAQAMLAQANQVPQGVLQLLQ